MRRQNYRNAATRRRKHNLSIYKTTDMHNISTSLFHQRANRCPIGLPDSQSLRSANRQYSTSSLYKFSGVTWRRLSNDRAYVYAQTESDFHCSYRHSLAPKDSQGCCVALSTAYVDRRR